MPLYAARLVRKPFHIHPRFTNLGLERQKGSKMHYQHSDGHTKQPKLLRKGVQTEVQGKGISDTLAA